MEPAIEKLIGFVLILTRLSAFFLILPVFGWVTIPIRLKAAMAIIVSIFFSTVVTIGLNSTQVSFSQASLLISNEAIYGLALGLVARIIFSAVKVGGEMVEDQIGFRMSEVLDPLTGESSQSLSSLLEMIFILLFLSANGHHLFISIISKSYESFPVGSIPTIDILAGGIVNAGSAMLIAGLKLAAPILAAFLLLMVVLAILARIVPEMNILFISLPVRVGLGLFMVAVFIPFLSTFVSEFAELMNKLIPI
ncbi:MAG: flagellar biosynthetic protein FliR [Sedimentisphaerales bacterium]|nr:flagellar biosynthetic protein FliR [Sedimentisphaerales bacterium]